jgi:hypothetical protein
MALDREVFDALKKIYTTLPQTTVATGATWLLCRSVSRLGLDAKTTAIFTAAASVMWYGSRTFFESYDHTISRDLAMHVGLSYVAKEMLNLDLPLYKQFGKAYGVAVATIAAIEFGFNKLNGESRRRSDFL